VPSRHLHFWGSAIAVAISCVSVRSSACSPVTRANIVPCALARSIETGSEREGLSAAQGRRDAASTILPSNPSVYLSAGQPVAYAFSSSSLTWGVSVAQELEIGGQRGHRIDAANAERSAQTRRIAATQREVVRGALTAYFDALAAREASALAHRLGAVAQALSIYASSRSGVGLVSPVEAAVAQAEAVRLSQLELAAELQLNEALTTLTSSLGQDPTQATVEIEGQLEPLLIADVSVDGLMRGAITERADVQVAAAENQAASARAALLRASRIPNPTLSVFYKKDWFEERTAGIGLSFPLPLPSPVGRTFAGEITEADALARRARLETQRLQRDVRLQVLNAKLTLDTRKRERELFTPDSIAQAETGVDAIGEALRGQKIAIRDALLSEKALVDLLLNHIEARRRLCLASVELAHAAGFAVERGVQ
jgi:outer membrane protein, heavy metal efflux system